MSNYRLFIEDTILRVFHRNNINSQNNQIEGESLKNIRKI